MYQEVTAEAVGGWSLGFRTAYTASAWDHHTEPRKPSRGGKLMAPRSQRQPRRQAGKVSLSYATERAVAIRAPQVPIESGP